MNNGKLYIRTDGQGISADGTPMPMPIAPSLKRIQDELSDWFDRAKNNKITISYKQYKKDTGRSKALFLSAVNEVRSSDVVYSNDDSHYTYSLEEISDDIVVVTRT